jgi:hypothetical protein
VGVWPANPFSVPRCRLSDETEQREASQVCSIKPRLQGPFDTCLSAANGRRWRVEVPWIARRMRQCQEGSGPSPGVMSSGD